MKAQETAPIALEEKSNLFLSQAYKDIRGEEPIGLLDWQIAEGIVEVLDDANWLSPDLAKECLYTLVHVISYPDRETQIRIVRLAEEKARTIFPELRHIDEVHMDQIEYLYNEWKLKAS